MPRTTGVSVMERRRFRARRSALPSPVAVIRKAEARDCELIEQMLLAAFDWRPGTTPRPVANVMADPSVAHYAEGWLRDTDLGVVAEDDETGLGLGAAWWRFFTLADPGYGFVSEAVPEVSIGVVTGARGVGLGRALLYELVTFAHRQSLAGLSLSVEPDNFALHLHEQVGFTRVGECGGSLTMMLSLDRR